ncbi:hypothetical protein ABVK25_010456 [Lepraria finkii]|uniref:Uncharacterized protein n=1 Tax=Lepraria finkii TaxID=1340010 RepID=A0ABR4AVV6_9LECA
MIPHTILSGTPDVNLVMRPETTLHCIANTITSPGNRRIWAPQASPSSGRSTGNRTSDSMTSRSKSSASGQRPESQVTYGSRDYKDDVRSDEEGESQYHKNSSFPEDQGRREKEK